MRRNNSSGCGVRHSGFTGGRFKLSVVSFRLRRSCSVLRATASRKRSGFNVAACCSPPSTLLTQRLGHRLALCLVVGVEREPLLRFAEVEENERGVGLLLIDQLPERFAPPVQRAGGKAFGRRELGQRVEAAVREIKAVDEEPF